MTEPSRRVALVTGGSSGIGLAVATMLVSAGLHTFLCARTAEDVETAVKELDDGSAKVAGAVCDVRSPAQVRTLVRTVVERFGSISVLINSAGRSGGGVTADIPDELWYDVIDTNLNGVFLMTREVLARGGMRDQPYGRIVNIASTGGKQGVVLGAPYSASKHAVIGFTKALGLELAKTGVTVNAVCPGYVETPMAQRVRQGYAQHWGITEDAVLQRFEAKIPLGRYATPAEVAGMVTYLLSDAAAPVTAQAINVCGGLGNY
jgi:ketoreductase